jgi:hypothetical protein
MLQARDQNAENHQIYVRKVSTSCASATTGLVGGATLPSDIVEYALSALLS